MDFVKLTEEKLDIGKISEEVTCSSTGAVSIFVGTTRDHFGGKEVVKLEYEAYDGMAEKEIKKLCGEIREKWPVKNIAMYHRLGEVPAKEASVVIAISSEHRTESLQAVQWAIDTLKARIPIWKKEIYKEGQGEWKANKECAWSSKTEKKKDDDVTLIQVNASNEEIERRIAAFVERKRHENDITNVREFCSRFSVHDPAANSCARTDAVLVSRKDSKSHLRISRVVNISGPQTSSNERVPIKSENLPKVDKIVSPESSLPSAIEERLKCIEESSGVLLGEGKPVPKHFYERLKLLEDRLLHLESISPEYMNGDWMQATSKGHEKRKAVSVSDLDNRMATLKKKLRCKQELQE